MITLEEVLARSESLPTISAVVVKLGEMVHDPTTTASDFEAVIRTDPALTANLLHMGKSAFFASTHKVSSVRHAVVLLGTKRVFEIAAAVGFASVLPERLPGYQVSSIDLWRHCIAVAVYAEKLGRRLGLRAPDLIFTAALLHDIGKLAVGAFLEEAGEDDLVRIIEDEGRPLLQVEQALLGIDHTIVGEALAVKWGLPSTVSFACRWHHNPELAPQGVDRTLVDLVHVADCMAHMFGLGADVGGLARSVSSSSASRLRLTTDHLESVAGEALIEIEQIADQFGA